MQFRSATKSVVEKEAEKTVSAKSGIEWTDATWNPTRGCSKVSAGCANCYAEKVAARFARIGEPYSGTIDLKTGKWSGIVTLAENKLTEPLSWKKPRRVFVDSMSDLFHKDVPDEYIDDVFCVMAYCEHTFQVLTKRPERMAAYCQALRDGKRQIGDSLKKIDKEGFVGRLVLANAFGLQPGNGNGNPPYQPFKNVWLGVSIEDQKTADERIPWLLKTPAAVRFVSYEPALGPIKLWLPTKTFERCDGSSGCAHCCNGDRCDDPTHFSRESCPYCRGTGEALKIDWLICGGESGPKARPMEIEWAVSAADQCATAGVPFFMKQLGGHPDKRAEFSYFPEPIRRREMPH